MSQAQSSRVYIITNRNVNYKKDSDKQKTIHTKPELQINGPSGTDKIPGATRPILYDTSHLLYSHNNEDYRVLFKSTEELYDKNKHQDVIGRLFNDGTPDNAILFVHGFNNSVDEAENYARQIANSMGKDVIVYAWPCTYNNWDWQLLRSYAIDSEMAVASVRPLNWILCLLLDNMKLDIICHSMGSRIVVGAISNGT